MECYVHNGHILFHEWIIKIIIQNYTSQNISPPPKGQQSTGAAFPKMSIKYEFSVKIYLYYI